ncbi:virulence protein [Selenomonas sp. oral taxon 920]|uniref:virulence protein n=1 Tax=Selenomonas sp. oral taxon 920 TaxID=1884263 RepID=UPI000840DE83|nr:virulence protein [Selenomonas sp. oral taxon 920]AOH48059.1 virulence protein [Selenomonas sp. oral taxon 920]
MKVNYNIQKEERKAMVGIVGKVLETKPAYCGAPSFSYKVGAFEITKAGILCFDDATDEATVARVRTALREAGFMSEDGENKASCADTGEDKPIQTEAAEDELAAVETAEIEPSQTKTAADEPTVVETEADKQIQTETAAEVAPTEEAVAESGEDSLSISLPRSLFTETALQNLDALLLSKGRLIRHAFDIKEATYTLTDDRITFAWLHGTITDETAKAYAEFISKFCQMARTQKRVTAKKKIVDNEKYAFRCFLLRLGMIGNAYKQSRKILLQNLTGSSAFKSGHRKEVVDHAISE